MEIIQDKFIDKVFGDEIEYIVIKNEEEKILIFQYGNKIHIITISTVKELIENLIECKILSEFLKETVEEQDSYIDQLEDDLSLFDEDMED